MRCKKHLSDLSSSIGVCATCLRDKLFSLIETQSHPKSISDNPNPNFSNLKQPQPLIFPRSVSPYIARRKSDQLTSNKPIIQRFYSTPQVGPTFVKKNNSKIAGKFNLIAKLFRSKSTVVSTSAASSEVGIRPAELTRFRTRGMSPQNESDDSEEVTCYHESPSAAARTRPSPGRVRPSPARLASNVASFAFCLSPLVRASPASRYHWGSGSGSGEPSMSGEIRVSVTGKGASSGGGNYNNSGGLNSKNPQLGEAASYCANRSRKLVDFGRLNRNR